MGDDTQNTTPAPQPQPQQGQAQGGIDRDAIMRDLLKTIAQQTTKPQQSIQAPQVNPKASHMSGGQVATVGALGMFMPFLGGAVAKSIKNQKEAQINEATAEFMALQRDWETAWQMSGGDEQKAREMMTKMPSASLFDANNPSAKKRLKNFAKVFSIDWMNPDKTTNTVHFQAMQKAIKLQEAGKQMQSAKQQMDSMKQQPQPGQEGQGDQQSMLNRFIDQFRKTTPPDLGKAEGLMRGLTSLQNADTNRDREDRLSAPKFEKVETSQGMFMRDPKDPNGTLHPLMYDGKQITSGRISGSPGKPVTVNGVPMGIIAKDGHTVKTPKDPNWTTEDQTQYDQAMAAYKAGEEAKDKRAAFIANSRFTAYLQTRFYDAFDSDTNTLVKVNPAMMQKDPGRYGPAGLAAQMAARESMFDEINATSTMLKESFEKLPDYVFSDPTVRARLSYIMASSEHPMDALTTFMQSSVARTLPQPGTPDGDAIMDYLTGLASMAESANSARSLGGMGQGSDYIRRAIREMLPSGKTPTKAYAKEQMRKFDIEMSQLKHSLLKVGRNKADREGDKQVIKKGQVPD